jgi:hypothetical protein
MTVLRCSSALSRYDFMAFEIEPVVASSAPERGGPWSFLTLSSSGGLPAAAAAAAAALLKPLPSQPPSPTLPDPDRLRTRFRSRTDRISV